MTTKEEAPETIWLNSEFAKLYAREVDSSVVGSVFSANVEYIRADRYQHLQKEITRLRTALEEIAGVGNITTQSIRVAARQALENKS